MSNSRFILKLYRITRNFFTYWRPPNKEILSCDSVTTNITSITPKQIENISDKIEDSLTIYTEIKSSEDKEMNDFHDSIYKERIKIWNRPQYYNLSLIAQLPIKQKIREIDIQPLIQELRIEPLEEDTIKIVNVDKNYTDLQSN
ncbi:hypothetical protein Glove_465g50 [Diversispora epigaea]|uniref:Uncharacterized protein n=1 Tax=Diversispora epigaea TaxID=1348612 RepID=A0A397GQW6_9GLOM|nr:hypothetical protein Glove_465g50 [Diversispora epigaea]